MFKCLDQDRRGTQGRIGLDLYLQQHPDSPLLLLQDTHYPSGIRGTRKHGVNAKRSSPEQLYRFRYALCQPQLA